MNQRNVIIIEGHKAVISYDPEINMLRGEFVGLNGGADFYASDIPGLVAEGETSLHEFIAVCNEEGISPYRHFSGKFQLRLDEGDHENATVVAAARGVSLNNFIAEAIRHEIECAE